jgi:HAD superfamily hydrolase (TIGR01509 family)
MRAIAGYVAFDLDGCLWDSDRLHFDAVNMALSPYQQRITEEEHRTIFKGLPTKRKLAMLTEMGRLPQWAHADVERFKREATLIAIENTQPRSEVSALLIALCQVNWRVCCCSNSILDTVQMVLLKMGILKYMDFVLSNEDVARAKPSPEIYQKAARIWGIQPQEIVVVEDGEAGKRSALDAGCTLIEVSGPHDVEPWLIHKILAVGRWDIRSQDKKARESTVGSAITV